MYMGIAQIWTKLAPNMHLSMAMNPVKMDDFDFDIQGQLAILARSDFGTIGLINAISKYTFQAFRPNLHQICNKHGSKLF